MALRLPGSRTYLTGQPSRPTSTVAPPVGHRNRDSGLTGRGRVPERRHTGYGSETVTGRRWAYATTSRARPPVALPGDARRAAQRRLCDSLGRLVLPAGHRETRDQRERTVATRWTRARCQESIHAPERAEIACWRWRGSSATRSSLSSVERRPTDAGHLSRGSHRGPGIGGRPRQPYPRSRIGDRAVGSRAPPTDAEMLNRRTGATPPRTP